MTINSRVGLCPRGRSLWRLNKIAIMAYAKVISKKRQFVADGVFYAELNELFDRELAENGYAGSNFVTQPPAPPIKLHFSLMRPSV